MSTEEVVDVSGTSIDGRFRRVWLRIGVPIGGVALVIVAILAIVLYSDRVNRAGVLLLSDDLLAGLQDRIAQEVTAYFDPATRATRLARDMVANNVITDRRAALEAFASSALRQIPQIDAFYVGDTDGSFMMVQRGAEGGTDTKLIRASPGTHVVEWVRHDAEGRVTKREQDPADNYDPRTREWYLGAIKTDDTYWTGVYVFFTHRSPGVTAAVRYRSADSGTEHVFGVDITLAALSGFLASLKIGISGRAVIIDDTGHLIAAPDASRVVHEVNGQLVTARLDQLDDPALIGAYDRFRVQGYGRRVITVDGSPIVSIASPLPTVGRHWSLLMVVPEKDFTGFVASNSRKTFALSLVVVLLTALMAALLVRQGLRADRTARLLLDRGKAMERQSSAFAGLTRQADFFDCAQGAPMQALTAILADLAAARRVSIWRVSDNRRLLHCEDEYQRGTDQHVDALQLSRAELPQFFAALEAGKELNVADAVADRRTTELHRVLMHPFNSRSLHVTPVQGADSVLGAIILEDAEKISDAGDFINLVANMLAIRMRGATETPMTARPEARETSAAPPCERSFTAELTLRGLDLAATGADVFPSMAVMVIKFNDWVALAASDATDGSVFADRLVATLQDIAEEHDIPYMKLVGDDVMAAAGYARDDATAILRIADAAVAVRERCLELFEAANRRPSFRIGIDYGIAIGSQVGRQPRLFNLWGEAVHTAVLMASSGAGPGSIQVSEAAYHHLRQHFLFRPRGSFYLPRVGAAQTFVLGARR